jgi:hypothetical protein
MRKPREIKEVTFKIGDLSMVPNIVKNSEPADDLEERLTTWMKESDYCWVAFADGEAGCIWGLKIQNIILGHVYLWVHLTNIAKQNEVRFLRGAKKLIYVLAQRYRFINGHLDPKEPKAKRWIPWLGFTIGETQEFELLTGQKMQANVFWMGER